LHRSDGAALEQNTRYALSFNVAKQQQQHQQIQHSTSSPHPSTSSAILLVE
jgi:hypothetical protein